MAVTRALRKDAGIGHGNGPKHPKVFREFRGLNTQAARQAIAPGEFSWLENVQPIGHGNAKVVADRSVILSSVTEGEINYFKFFNIAGVAYMFASTDTGHAYQMRLTSPYTVTEISDNASPQFSTSGVRIDQWKNERILIIDPANGYFSWDGSLLIEPGYVVAVDVTSGGAAYTAIPTISFTGGGGVGATAVASMTLDGAQTITVAGTGYVAGDIITLVGGTFVTPGKLQVTTVGGGGAITGVTIYDPGEYSVLPVAPAATTGGGNDDATITPAYAVLSVTVTLGGTSPYSAAPTVVFSSGAATADAVLLQGPTRGQHICVFSGYVWVSNGRTLQWSAPDSYYDFAGTGSGSKIVKDATLVSDITSLTAANNFLYYTGEASVNVIGDVPFDGSETIFSDTNLTAAVGTDYDLSIVPYYRSLLMQNKSGVYAIYGASPVKASDNLDGIIPRIVQASIISGGQVMLENILCAAFMFQYDDGLNVRPLMAIFFNKKWFLASQGDDLVLMANAVIDGEQVLFATDGTNLYRLFARGDYAVPWTLQTALWDMEDLTRGKQITKFGFEMNVLQSEGTVSVTIDALQSQNDPDYYYSSDTYQVDASGIVIWFNDADEAVEWENDVPLEVFWLGNGYFLDMEDGTAFGKYIGITMSSQNVRGNLYSALLEYTLRESW